MSAKHIIIAIVLLFMPTAFANAEGIQGVIQLASDGTITGMSDFTAQAYSIPTITISGGVNGAVDCSNAGGGSGVFDQDDFIGTNPFTGRMTGTCAGAGTYHLVFSDSPYNTTKYYFSFYYNGSTFEPRNPYFGPLNNSILAVGSPTRDGSPYPTDSIPVSFTYSVDSNESRPVYACWYIYDLTGSGNVLTPAEVGCDTDPLLPGTNAYTGSQDAGFLEEGKSYGFRPILSYTSDDPIQPATSNVPPMSQFYIGETIPSDFENIYYGIQASTTSAFTCEWDIPVIGVSADPCETAYYFFFPQPGAFQNSWIKFDSTLQNKAPFAYVYDMKDIFLSFATATTSDAKIGYQIDFLGEDMTVLSTSSNPFMPEPLYDSLRALMVAAIYVALGFAIWGTRNKLFS